MLPSAGPPWELHLAGPGNHGGEAVAAAAAATHTHSLSHSLQRRLKMYVLGGSNRMQNPQAQQRENKALEKVLNKTIHSGALRALPENAESRRLITSIKTCFHQQKKKRQLLLVICAF